MAHWAVIEYRRLARCRSVGVLLDLHKPGDQSFAVAAAYRGVTYWISSYYDSDTAYDIAQEVELCWAGPEGDSSWLVVLDRLLGKSDREPWEGSDAERAGRCYAPGTWNWLAVLSRIKNKVCSST